MMLYPKDQKGKFYQTVGTQDPLAGEQIPWKNLGALRLIDDNGDFVDIPRHELRLTQPKKAKASSRRSATPPPVHDVSQEELTEPPLTPLDAEPPSSSQTKTPLYADDISSGHEEQPGDLVLDQQNTEPVYPLSAQESEIVGPTVATAEESSTVSVPPEQLPGEEPTTPIEPAAARKILSLIGLEAAGQRVADLVEKYFAKNRRNIWKNGFRPYFEERLRQFYTKAVEISQNPFIEKSLELAETRAKQRYAQELDALPLLRRKTRDIWQRIKSGTGATTRIQELTLSELRQMRESGENEIFNQEKMAFDQAAKDVNKRMELEFTNQDEVVRQGLGEYLNILAPGSPEYNRVFTPLKDLMGRRLAGNITQQQYNQERDAFFETHIKPLDEARFQEAALVTQTFDELYETLQQRLDHDCASFNLDQEMDGLEIRLGLAVMGEATSLEPTAANKATQQVKRLVDWMQKKDLVRAGLISDAAVATGVSAAVALSKLPLTLSPSLARVWGGALAGGTAAGILGGWKQYWNIRQDYLTHTRQREAGAIFASGAKQRGWMEKFLIKQRKATELVSAMNTALYTTDGTLKDALTPEEIQQGLAHLADAKARKALSARENQRIGLIRFSSVSAIETERTALDATIIRVERDLKAYLEGHTDQRDSLTGGQDFDHFLNIAASGQQQVLEQGVRAIESFADPVKNTLGLLSEFNPEVEIVRRRFGIGRANPQAVQGMDRILEEFNRAAIGEAAKYGIKRGAYGVALGALLQEGIMDIQHLRQTGDFELIGAISQGFRKVTGLDPNVILNIHPPAELATAPDIEHLGSVPLSGGYHDLALGDQHIQAPSELDWVVDAQGHHDLVLKGVDAAGHPHDILIADNVKWTGDHPTNPTEVLEAVKHHPLLSYDAGTAAAEKIHSVDQHLEAVKGLAPIEGQPIQANIPNGTSLVSQGDNTFNLVDTEGTNKGTVLLHGIRIDNHGQITNIAELNHSAEALANHIRVADRALPALEIKTATEVSGTFDKMVGDMGNERGLHGPWGWLEDPINAHGDIEHKIPATNLWKNIFRGYEENWIDHATNSNVDIEQIPGYHRDIHWDIADQKINYNAMPSNMWFRDLPRVLFAEDQGIKLGHLMDEAIKMKEIDGLALESMDKIHRLTYEIGRIGRVASKDELSFIMDYLGGGEKVTTVIPHQAQIFQDLVEKVPGTPASIGVTGEELTNIIGVGEPTPEPLPQIPIPVIPAGGGRRLEAVQPKEPLPPPPYPPYYPYYPYYPEYPDYTPSPEYGTFPYAEPSLYAEYPQYEQYYSQYPEYFNYLIGGYPYYPQYPDYQPNLIDYGAYRPYLPIYERAYEALNYSEEQRQTFRRLPPELRAQRISEAYGLSYDSSLPYPVQMEKLASILDVPPPNLPEYSEVIEAEPQTKITETEPVIINVFEKVKDVSPALRSNPETALDEKTEIERYFSLHSEAYRDQLKTLDAKIGRAMSENCRVAICIPAYHEEKNIYRVLEGYANQKGIPLDQLEVIVLDNHRIEKNKDKTELEVRRFQKDYPELNISYVYAVFPKQYSAMGNIRKISQDIALFRASQRSSSPGDLIIASNDADSYGFRQTAFKSIIQLFDKKPDLDIMVSKFNYPEEAFRRFPILRAIFLFDKTYRLNVDLANKKQFGETYLPTLFSTGFLTYYRAKTYAAVGGYHSSIVRGSDVNIGQRIMGARRDKYKHGLYTNSPKVRIDPRRALSKMISGRYWINEWDDKVWQESLSVVGKDWREFSDPGIEVFTKERFQNEINAWLRKRLEQHKQRRRTLTEKQIISMMAPLMDQTFNRLGIKAKTEPGHVVILETSKFEKNLFNKEQEPEPAPSLVTHIPEVNPLSDSIKSNPEAQLNDQKESLRYLRLLPEAYQTELESLNAQIQTPMSSECKLAISIPAFKAEKTIYRTLLQYVRQQNFDPKHYEIHVLVDSNNRNRQVNQATWQEFQRFKTNYPHIPVYYMHADFGGIKPPIGLVRKVGTDLALLRRSKEAWAADQGFVVAMNDADCWGIKERGLSSIMAKFESDPQLGVVVGRYNYPIDSYRQFPLFHAVVLFDRTERRIRSDNSVRAGKAPIPPWGTGISTFMRSGAYCSIGGFDKHLWEHEDSTLVARLRSTKRLAARHSYWSDEAEYTTDPRRPLNAMIIGKYWVGQWGKGDKDLHDPRVAGKTWHEFSDPQIEIITKKRLEEEMNALIDFRLKSSYRNNLKAFKKDSIPAYQKFIETVGLDASILPDGHIQIRSVEKFQDYLLALEWDQATDPVLLSEHIRRLSRYRQGFPDGSEERKSLEHAIRFLEQKVK